MNRLITRFPATSTRPFGAHFVYGLAGLALLLACAVGCTDSPDTPSSTSSTAPTQIQGGPLTLPENSPATPAPSGGPTPFVRPSTPMATPTPVMPDSPIPSPSQPVVLPSDATGTADPSASPLPDKYKKTGSPTDLAVSGPAYFMLSTKPDPAAVEDLLFTRNGHFKLVRETVGNLSVFRLRHDPDNFPVVGYTRTGAADSTAPDERSGQDAQVLTTSWSGITLSAQGLFLDADRNPDTLSKLTFDYRGRLSVSDVDPRDSAGNSEAMIVGLAQFEHPDQLAAQAGFDGIFKYQSAAGAMTLGVAVSGAGRSLGNANLVLTGTLEAP